MEHAMAQSLYFTFGEQGWKREQVVAGVFFFGDSWVVLLWQEQITPRNVVEGEENSHRILEV